MTHKTINLIGMDIYKKVFDKLSLCSLSQCGSRQCWKSKERSTILSQPHSACRSAFQLQVGSTMRT